MNSKVLQKRPVDKLIILEDNPNFIIINKPAWLLSVPGKDPMHKDSVLSQLESLFKVVYVAHRLDWATSGVMVFAKNKPTLRNLNKQFAERITKKSYIAIVYNRACFKYKKIELPIRCDWDNRPRQIVDPILGKPSTTEVYVDWTNDNYSRLILKPITGRSHQLRVHLSQIDHPIVGDQLYAGEAAKKEPRMQLHAEELSFLDPTTNEEISFCAPCPF